MHEEVAWLQMFGPTGAFFGEWEGMHREARTISRVCMNWRNEGRVSASERRMDEAPHPIDDRVSGCHVA